MIKLERGAPPAVLSAEAVRQLTEEFIKTAKSVWNIPAVKSALLTTAHGKCAYCECDLSRESHYVEVEHFTDKERNPLRVVDWTNLLPSCKRCNVAKGTHDVTVDPIVNPYEQDPREHFELRLYRFKGRTPIGEATLGVIDLNNHERVVTVRFEIGEAIQEAIAILAERLKAYAINSSTRSKNRLISSFTVILKECQPAANYAATAATILLRDEAYIAAKKSMEQLNLWDVGLQILHRNAEQIALPCELTNTPLAVILSNTPS